MEPMLLLSTEKLPQGPDWLYEIKLDGYRALAIKTGGRVQLRSRNDNDFTTRYAPITAALRGLTDETVVDGEVVALDEEGRPSFHLLQNFPKSRAHLAFFVFDVLILQGRDVTGETLEQRRRLLEKHVLTRLTEPIRYSPELKENLADLVHSVKLEGLEGLVAKRRSSRYEPGRRSGAWRKMRVNRGQEFVIGGYTPSNSNFDALIFGYYDGGNLRYVARTRNGFTPSTRQEVFKRLKPLEIRECPFANLPEARSGRWGAGLTAAKMKTCRWLKPVLVGQFEFAEWTPDHHLRHSRFITLRDDKEPKTVLREG
jgi:bifunctional non-homologous end joining protein LigD